MSTACQCVSIVLSCKLSLSLYTNVCCCCFQCYTLGSAIIRSRQPHPALPEALGQSTNQPYPKAYNRMRKKIRQRKDKNTQFKCKTFYPWKGETWHCSLWGQMSCLYQDTGRTLQITHRLVPSANADTSLWKQTGKSEADCQSVW